MTFHTGNTRFLSDEEARFRKKIKDMESSERKESIFFDAKYGDCIYCGKPTDILLKDNQSPFHPECSYTKLYEAPEGELAAPQQRQLTRLDLIVCGLITSVIGFIGGLFLMAEVML